MIGRFFRLNSRDSALGPLLSQRPPHCPPRHSSPRSELPAPRRPFRSDASATHAPHRPWPVDFLGREPKPVTWAGFLPVFARAGRVGRGCPAQPLELLSALQDPGHPPECWPGGLTAGPGRPPVSIRGDGAARRHHPPPHRPWPSFCPDGAIRAWSKWENAGGGPGAFGAGR